MTDEMKTAIRGKKIELTQACESGLLSREFNYTDNDTITKVGGRAKVDDLWRIHRTMLFRSLASYPILDNATGQYIMMTQQEVERLCNEMDAFGCDSYQALATKVAQVDACTTIEEVTAITWE
jgi:hypothetical protein